MCLASEEALFSAKLVEHRLNTHLIDLNYPEVALVDPFGILVKIIPNKVTVCYYLEATSQPREI